MTTPPRLPEPERGRDAAAACRQSARSFGTWMAGTRTVERIGVLRQNWRASGGRERASVEVRVKETDGVTRRSARPSRALTRRGFPRPGDRRPAGCGPDAAGHHARRWNLGAVMGPGWRRRRRRFGRGGIGGGAGTLSRLPRLTYRPLVDALRTGGWAFRREARRIARDLVAHAETFVHHASETFRRPGCGNLAQGPARPRSLRGGSPEG